MIVEGFGSGSGFRGISYDVCCWWYGVLSDWDDKWDVFWIEDEKRLYEVLLEIIIGSIVVV